MKCLVSYRVVLLSCVVWLLNLIKFTQSHAEIPLLLLVSFDGFRWDYLSIAKQRGYSTPNFDRLINNGVAIGNGGLKNTFITKTFPNHFTLVTGLYEENHGIVANSFFDPEFNETFSIGNSVQIENRKWWDGKSATNYKGVEPVWVTNENAGSRRVSGSYFWPGAIVDNQRPHYTRCYSNNTDYAVGVDTVVEWFVNDVNPINLGLLYINEPDHTGHKTGAASTAVMEKIVMLDGILGHLLTSLEHHNLLDRMNIIVTSDHGMVNATKSINADDYVDPSLYTVYGSSPVWSVLPVAGKEDEVYQAFKKVSNLTVYKKEEIPDDFHYQNNRRVLPIIVTAAEGFNLCQNKTIYDCQLKGTHGYNNSLQTMHPIFLAHGPAFKKNYTSTPFNNVDVYPLMCHILEIKPHANDGNLMNVKHILADDESDEDGESISVTMITFLGSVGITAFVSGVCCIAACRSHRIYIRKKGQHVRRANAKTMDMTETKQGNIQPLLASEEEDFA